MDGQREREETAVRGVDEVTASRRARAAGGVRAVRCEQAKCCRGAVRRDTSRGSEGKTGSRPPPRAWGGGVARRAAGREMRGACATTVGMRR